MSDQPPPPHELRLKLKQPPAKTPDAPPPAPPAGPAAPEAPPPAPPKTEAPVTPSPDAGAGSATAGSAGTAPDQVKLKMRVAIKPAEPAEPPAAAPPILAQPPAPVKAGGAPAEEFPRPQVPIEPLKSGLSGSGPSMSVSWPAWPTGMPGTSAPDVTAETPTPLPGGAEGAEAILRLKLKSNAAMPAGLPAAGGEAQAASAPARPEKKTAPRRPGSLGRVITLGGFALFFAVVYVTYRKHSHVPQPQAEPVEAIQAPLAPQTALGRAVQRTRDATATAEQSTAAANEVVRSADSHTPAAVPPPVRPPTARFRTVVNQLKIGGVRVGPPARLFVGGVTYQEGDFIDGSLRVIFVGVDTKTNELVFKDANGAEVRRPY